jgi:hypothetical protein
LNAKHGTATGQRIDLATELAATAQRYDSPAKFGRPNGFDLAGKNDEKRSRRIALFDQHFACRERAMATVARNAFDLRVGQRGKDFLAGRYQWSL